MSHLRLRGRDNEIAYDPTFVTNSHIKCSGVCL